MSGDDQPKLGKITGQVLVLLQQHPEGLRLKDLRERLELGTGQQHFDRRIRDIRKYYELTIERVGLDDTLYVLGPRREQQPADSGQVSQKLRAAVMHAAHGRCQMCGRTVAEDGVKLQADHKIPQTWGGRTELDNLWALCADCNRGKRDYFASFDPEEMKAILRFESVHERIAQVLKMHLGQPVSEDLLEFVANATDQQRDWQKRLRELRYPVIGLKIEPTRRKINGRVKVFYTLQNWVDLPSDHVRLMKGHERATKARSRQRAASEDDE